MGEFDLIRRYFSPPVLHTRLAGGDDAALIVPSSRDTELALTTDLLVAGQHFFMEMEPERLGYKAAAVNLSDIAAMGAQPRWALLGLVLPTMDEPWVEAFSRGFRQSLASYQVDWIGGDTTAGPMALAVTMVGEVPQGQALRRSGACVGDDIWVSGTLGDAALGLDYRLGRCQLPEVACKLALERFELPVPRVELGMALRGLAHSAIDLSDGLLADLDHLVTASRVGAVLEVGCLPVSLAQPGTWRDVEWCRRVLQGGEDYELCFTAEPCHRSGLSQLGAQLGVPLTRIGTVTAEPKQRLLRDPQGVEMSLAWRGFDHFQDVS